MSKKTYKTDYMIQFGQNIRARRMAKHMTQEDLAMRVGYTGNASRTAINKIESGSTDIPVSRVISLAKALDCTTSDLINCIPLQNSLVTITISETEAQLLDIYRHLNQDGQAVAIDILEILQSHFK